MRRFIASIAFCGLGLLPAVVVLRPAVPQAQVTVADGGVQPFRVPDTTPTPVAHGSAQPFVASHT